MIESQIKQQLEISALHAAIELYCCHKGSGGGHIINMPGFPEGGTEKPIDFEQLLAQLFELRDRLLATV